MSLSQNVFLIQFLRKTTKNGLEYIVLRGRVYRGLHENVRLLINQADKNLRIAKFKTRKRNESRPKWQSKAKSKASS